MLAYDIINTTTLKNKKKNKVVFGNIWGGDDNANPIIWIFNFDNPYINI